MKYQKEEISDLRWLGRRMDNLYNHIQQKHPDMVEGFLETVGNLFESIISNDLNQDEEDYLFELVDNEIDEFEKIYKITF
jgi:hypothetical protein